jgi:hypothetical protein
MCLTQFSLSHSAQPHSTPTPQVSYHKFAQKWVSSQMGLLFLFCYGFDFLAVDVAV